MELKGFVLDDDNSMHAVSFEIEDGFMSARRDGDIWDYSEDPNDFIKLIKDKVFTRDVTHDNMVVYDNVISLSKWLVEGGVMLDMDWYSDEINE